MEQNMNILYTDGLVANSENTDVPCAVAMPCPHQKCSLYDTS